MPQRIRLSDWTRTGCVTCKQRHKKCSGEKPKCAACARLNLECVPTEVFSPFMADKEKRSTKPRKRTTTPGTKDASDRNMPPGATILYNNNNNNNRNNSERGDSPSSPGPSREMCHFGAFNTAIMPPAQLPFQYFVERLSGLLVNAIGDENPLRTLIVPRVMHSPLLLNTVCAVSCLHRSRHAEGEMRTRYQTESTEYYVSALADMRKYISHAPLPDRAETSSSGAGGGGAGALPNDLGSLQVALLSSIFLCKYEIIKDGITHWRQHFEGIEFFSKLLSSNPRQASIADIQNFAGSFITYHKGLASLTEKGLRTEDVLGDGQDSALVLGSILQPVDPYMGFSRCYIILLRRVMALLSIDATDPKSVFRLQIEVESILMILGQGTRTAKDFYIPDGMTQDTTARLESVARAYECAIHICLHSVLDKLFTTHGGSGPCDGALTELKAMLPVTKEASITACLAEIARVPCNSPEEAGLLPLLFIVACETDCQEQSVIALERVGVLDAHVGFGNIQSTAALLGEVWTQRRRFNRSFDWRTLLASSNWDLIIT